MFLHKQEHEENNPYWPPWNELAPIDLALWHAAFPGWYMIGGMSIDILQCIVGHLVPSVLRLPQTHCQLSWDGRASLRVTRQVRFQRVDLVVGYPCCDQETDLFLKMSKDTALMRNEFRS